MGQGITMFRPFNDQGVLKKKIIIVGASFAGLFLARKLLSQDKHDKQFEILIIDKNEFFEYICNNTECFYDEQHFDNISIPYHKAMESFGSPQIQFKRGKLIKVFDEFQHIEIELPSNSIHSELTDQKDTLKLQYDYLVICTGSSYTYPIKENYNLQYNRRDRKSHLEQTRNEVEEAKSILVIGGGVNGVELVTNLASKYGTDKKLGIIARGPRLLPSMPQKASQAAENYIKNHGIFIYLNTEYNESVKEDLGYELTFNCTGFKFEGPRQYMQGALTECLDPQSGQIFVNQYLQVTNVDPFDDKKQSNSLEDRLQSKVFSNIFSIGDVCLTRANEEKAVVPIHIMTSILAHNIKVLSQYSTKELKQIPDVIPRLYIMNFGRDSGVLVWNDFVVTGKINAMIKRFLEWLNMGVLSNRKLAQILSKVQYKTLDVVFCLCRSKLTWCLPCNERKARRQKKRRPISQKK